MNEDTTIIYFSHPVAKSLQLICDDIICIAVKTPPTPAWYRCVSAVVPCLRAFVVRLWAEYEQLLLCTVCTLKQCLDKHLAQVWGHNSMAQFKVRPQININWFLLLIMMPEFVHNCIKMKYLCLCSHADAKLIRDCNLTKAHNTHSN